MQTGSALRLHLESLFPGASIVEVRPLGPDDAARDATTKAMGYGVPLRVTLRDPDGKEQRLVFRTASADEFGHDRRSDRACSMLLDWDTFGKIPRHVPALDVGALHEDGRLTSLRQSGEFYLLTRYVEGHVYAEDLRRIAREGRATPLDGERALALAHYLAELHRDGREDAIAQRRAARDLLGHGEGIFGVVDAYPDDVPCAPPERLQVIERLCLPWRWRLRSGPPHVWRTHGDFHPFNVVFTHDQEFTVLDTSRGSEGNSADDVTCMAVNYLFFGLEAGSDGRRALAHLWRRFWHEYLEHGNAAVLHCAPPYLAWRGLVLANPRFYPALPARARDAILGLVERVLEEPTLDLDAAERILW